MREYLASLTRGYDSKKIKYFILFNVLFGTVYTISIYDTFYIFIITLDSANLEVSPTAITQFLIRIIVLMLFQISMVIISIKIYEYMALKDEKITLSQRAIAYENEMQIIKQSTEAVTLLKHDMKNHLLMLGEMYRSDKKDEIEPYLDSILYQLDNDSIAQSNNFVIDSIINFKLGSARTKDFNVNVEISVPQALNIPPKDITAILGNLLDNAITATEKSEEKNINIKINYRMGNLIILIDNSFDGNLISENSKLKTTKVVKQNHGLGLKSVKIILEKYDGELETEYTSNVFSVSVLIPIEEK